MSFNICKLKLLLVHLSIKKDMYMKTKSIDFNLLYKQQKKYRYLWKQVILLNITILFYILIILLFNKCVLLRLI